jgi:hypothetical protein
MTTANLARAQTQPDERDRTPDSQEAPPEPAARSRPFPMRARTPCYVAGRFRPSAQAGEGRDD